MARAKHDSAESVEVHLDAAELGPPMRVGQLFQRRSRSHSTFSFAYAPEWLESELAFVLDPRLELYAGEQFAAGGSETFGIFLDSAPDRWGRLLLERREALAVTSDVPSARSPNGTTSLESATSPEWAHRGSDAKMGRSS